MNKQWDGLNQQDGYSKYIYICPSCDRPTFFIFEDVGPYDAIIKLQFPESNFGNPVRYLPKVVASLYDEARRCVSNQSYTAAVMVCRKILMHIAVEKEAKENRGFEYYIKYLDEKGYLPPDSREWVDHIRHQGNEANHQISLKNDKDAKQLVEFIEMLIKFIYEFSARVSGYKSRK